MTEPAPEKEPAAPQTASASDYYRDVLRNFTGRIVTMVNPESYEEAPMGHTITTGFYKAKVLKVGEDFLCVACEFVHRRNQTKEPVKQYIPLDKVKRISVMKQEVIVHL